MMKLITTLALAAALLSVHAIAGESVIKDSQDMDCFVYTPDPLDSAKTYQLVVGVHGAKGNGNGAAGMKNWANRGDIIVIGPSFMTKSDYPFQNGDGLHAQKLIDLFETLKKTYKLHDQMFLHGFSAGAQFTHRFTMLHPKIVCGCSSHSGGTWATDGYGQIQSKAKSIPFAISCGQNDTGKAFASSPYTRLEWYGRFKDEIDKEKFCYIGDTWPNTGHQMSPGAWDLTKQCFQIATGLPGQSATETVTISPNWKNLKSKTKSSLDSPSKLTSSTSALKPTVSAVTMQ